MRYGWHVITIPADDDTLGWLFSAGMYKTFAHPEVVVFGLDQEVGHWLINEVGDRPDHEQNYPWDPGIPRKLALGTTAALQ